MESANGKNHEHLSERELNAYAARQLSPGETLIADEHLAVCDACHEKFSSLAKTDRPGELNFAFNDLFAAASDDSHLSYEDQLEPYVNGILSEPDSLKVEDHLQNCRMCSAEVQDLQRFRIRLEQLEKTGEPEIKPARKGFFRIPAIFARNLPQTGLVFGALAFLLMAGTFIFLKWRTDEAVEITRATNNNSRPNQNSSVIAPTDANVSTTPDPASNNSIPAANTNITDEKLPAQTNKTVAPPAETAEPLPREVETALSSGTLAKPKVLEEVAGNPVQLLGDEDKTESFALKSPEFVTLSARPVFRWKSLDGASGYTVTVFDSNLKRVAKSENLTTNQWTPSSKLKPGEVYQWQVTAVKDGKPVTAPAAPAPEAKFKILGLKESGRLQAALAKAGKSNLARGVLYAQAGLLGDAEREFQAEINRNPQAKTARRLLGQIRSWRSNK